VVASLSRRAGARYHGDQAAAVAGRHGRADDEVALCAAVRSERPRLVEAIAEVLR
jgi:hypothetical protein